MGITAGDLCQKDHQPLAEILAPWLTEANFMMIHAWRGVGKTFFALSVAQAVASGSVFLKWKAPRARKVIYFDGEMGEAAIKGRLMKVDSAASCSAGVSSMKFITFEHTGHIIWNLADPVQQEYYTAACADYDLIMIDNISCCVRNVGRETDRDSWIRVQQWAVKMRSAGKTIVMIHHSGKMGTQRGISEREDALDTTVCLKRPDGYKPENGCEFELHFEKNRYFWGDDAESLWVELRTAGDSGLAWRFDKLSAQKNRAAIDNASTERISYNDQF